MYSYGGFQNCNLQPVIFSTIIDIQLKEDIFCQHLSTFNFYANTNRFRMTIYLALHLEYIFNSSYSVIDTNIMSTEFKLNKKEFLNRENILPFPIYIFKNSLRGFILY